MSFRAHRHALRCLTRVEAYIGAKNHLHRNSRRDKSPDMLSRLTVFITFKFLELSGIELVTSTWFWERVTHRTTSDHKVRVWSAVGKTEFYVGSIDYLAFIALNGSLLASADIATGVLAKATGGGTHQRAAGPIRAPSNPP
jgi:hypothetical protein